jgi:flagellar M-ring protein FliF
LDGNYKTIANADGKEELVYEPRPQPEIDRLAAIVKNAVGFSADRSDQLEVVNIAFDKTYLHEEQQILDQQTSREFYYDILKKVLIVAAAVLLFLYFRRKLKRFFAGLARVLPSGPGGPRYPAGQAAYSSSREESVIDTTIPEVAPEKRQIKLVDRMQKIAKEEPAEIAKVIKTMMVE